jgi:hypothetical protein
MLKLFILLVSSLLSSQAHAESCAEFAGRFHATDGNCYFGRMEIRFSPSTSTLAMTYNPGSHQFITSYIADGKEHSGDRVNTGKTYTASCVQNKIATKRVGLLKFPLLTNFELTTNGFAYTENLEGDKYSRHCSFVRE